MAKLPFLISGQNQTILRRSADPHPLDHASPYLALGSLTFWNAARVA